MIHRVSNIREDLNSRIFSTFDLHTKFKFIDVYSKQVVNNFNQLVDRVANTEQKRKHNEICQKDFSKLFAETFELGEMSRGRDIDMSLPLPAMLLGTHTASKLRY